MVRVELWAAAVADPDADQEHHDRVDKVPQPRQEMLAECLSGAGRAIMTCVGQSCDRNV